MGRRAAPETVVEVEIPDETNGDAPAEPRAPLNSAQRFAASAASSVEAADPFAAEAKYYTEIRTLNREVINLTR